jgi:hypothetical protein
MSEVNIFNNGLQGSFDLLKPQINVDNNYSVFKRYGGGRGNVVG